MACTWSVLVCCNWLMPCALREGRSRDEWTAAGLLSSGEQEDIVYTHAQPCWFYRRPKEELPEGGATGSQTRLFIQTSLCVRLPEGILPGFFVMRHKSQLHSEKISRGHFGCWVRKQRPQLYQPAELLTQGAKTGTEVQWLVYNMSQWVWPIKRDTSITYVHKPFSVNRPEAGMGSASCCWVEVPCRLDELKPQWPVQTRVCLLPQGRCFFH